MNEEPKGWGMEVLKKNIRIALLFFIIFTIKDLIFNEKIQWTDNVMISVMAFLVYAIWDWSSEPYKWNKNKD